jgi:hypothetical protein
MEKDEYPLNDGWQVQAILYIVWHQGSPPAITVRFRPDRMPMTCPMASWLR